ncbi:MAG TPA: glycosyltransferase family 4 protein [Steroidobacteraceae bacterium]|nr:glycosyltransferase family 4 protein [Steroidobacteraceae bacterium]
MSFSPHLMAAPLDILGHGHQEYRGACTGRNLARWTYYELEPRVLPVGTAAEVVEQMGRIALAVARGADAGSNRMRDPDGVHAPRYHLFDDAFDPVWDESILSAEARTGRVPAWWHLARQVLLRKSDCDAVITWGEKLTLALLIQQMLGDAGKPHVAMMYTFEKLNVRVPLQLLKRNLRAVITWSSVQRDALVGKIGFPRDRVYLIRHYVDQVFYSPRTAQEDMICAVGAEMRDYTTLVQAVRGTGIRCHIATDHVRIPGPIRLVNDRRVPITQIVQQTDTDVTQGRLTLPQLRDLYAKSRVVIVPLLHSETDNGVTCILEAMAMGKPVICSRTRGQVDVIQEGVTGLYVPVGDAAAMRAAIQSLWHDPARASEMGRNARAYVEKYHTLEMFTSTTRSAAEAALKGQPAPDAFWE